MKCVFDVKKKSPERADDECKKKDWGEDVILTNRILVTDFNPLIFHVGKGKGFVKEMKTKH